MGKVEKCRAFLGNVQKEEQLYLRISLDLKIKRFFKDCPPEFDKFLRSIIRPNMNDFKLIQFFIFTLIATSISACMPKATEKKANCGTNQAFNSVSRTCVSVAAVAEARKKPVGTKSSDTLSQETSKTIILTYTDANKNPALSCKVSNISLKIETLSPQLTSGEIFTKAELVFYAAQSAASALPLGADKTSALVVRDDMQAALAKARITFTQSTVFEQLGLLVTGAESIMAIASSYTSTYSAVKYYSDLTQTRLTDFDASKVIAENRCECSAGVCTTTIAPRYMQTGEAGFFYTVTDLDGESEAKAVTLTISATSGTTGFLKPVAASDYVSFAQNSTNASLSYSVSLPAAYDYYGTSSFSYTFNGTKSSGYGVTVRGKVSHCMDLVGSTGLNDTTCFYTPNSGDEYDIVTPAKAAVTIGDLSFVANKEGSAGNDITILYSDLQEDQSAVDQFANETQNFGLVASNGSDAFIRVTGNAINVFIVKSITTSEQIRDLINADVKAKALLVVTGGSSSVFPDPDTLTASAVSLSGGTDAFDKIGLVASNAYAASTNTANIMIKMTHTDHAPLTPTEYNSAYMPLVLTSASTTAEAEGTVVGQVITLPYYDADNSPTPKAVACSVDFTTLPNIGLELTSVVSPCSCVAGICSVSVVPTALFNGTAKFSYTIATIDQFSASTLTSGAESVNMTIWEVNQDPVLAVSSATVTASGVSSTDVAPLSNPLEMQENSTAAPSSAYICFTKIAGGGTDEDSQTLTLTPTQEAPTSNASMILTFGTILAPSATGNSCGTGQYLLPITVTKNQSGTTNIKLLLTDNGTTHSVADAKTDNEVIPFKVNTVNDPPYFIDQTITSIETNEGGAVVVGPFTVDEDEGNSPDEDTQEIRIANITSDNTSILPLSGISVFYDFNDNGVEDTGETRTFGSSSTALPASMDLEDSGTVDADVLTHKFYLKLNPIPGISGNSNIRLTINDGNVDPTHFVSTNLSFVVNPVSATHGGWNTISAVGIKTDKSGEPISSSDIVCNYNTSSDLHKCDTATSNCTGTSAPHSVVTPTGVNVLYWDSSNKRCYRSQSASDKFSWIEMKTSCPITRVTNSASAVCAGENCLYDPTLLPAQSVSTPTAIDQYYYNTSTKTCFYSTETTPGVFGWSSSYIPSKVTLGWNAFTIQGSGSDAFPAPTIVGWNVYRREAGRDYDFKNGFLKLNSTDTKSISSALTRSFTDKTALAGKVYYYLVRPIDSKHQFATYTAASHSEVRIYAPTENYSFIHRWMVNQEVCNSMHMTTSTTNAVDEDHNYRCPYKGPGESLLTPGYYDIEKDMLVDISESGCPYTPSPACSSNGCIGKSSPNTLLLTSAQYNVFYDRSSGTCYINSDNTGSATGLWKEINAASPTEIQNALIKSNTALNAPLVNLTQSQASSVCETRSTTGVVGGLSGLTAVATTASLPSKKEFIAYSSAASGISDSTLTEMELGYSLNAQSRCNSNRANGLEVSYDNSNIPVTSYLYSLPGTAASGIKSLYTGSIPWGNNYSTETCSSRFGVQDIYGNVAEWVSDKMKCNITKTKLSAAIDAAVTTVPASTSGFPSSGAIIIDTEVMTYTGITSTSFTGVTRGAYGSVAATHAITPINAEIEVYQRTNLAVDISDSASTLTVTSTTGFPTAGTLLIDEIEQVSYTGKTATTFTGVSRGLGETHAVSHTGPVEVNIDSTDASCSSISGTSLGDYDFATGTVLTSSYRYGFNLFTGPYNDSNADSAVSTGDLYLTSWSFRDELYGAGKFSFPVGMPIYTDIGSTALSASEALSNFLEIGPTSGITTSQLHEDGLIVNAAAVSSSANQVGAFAQGGSYLSGNQAGRYSSELVPDTISRPDIGFRCYIPVVNGNYPSDSPRHPYSY